jgi:hypothetical protein
MAKFVNDVLISKGFEKSTAAEEVAKLEKANIKTLDLLRKLNMADWEATHVSVGAARAVQDMLWQVRECFCR